MFTVLLVTLVAGLADLQVGGGAVQTGPPSPVVPRDGVEKPVSGTSSISGRVSAADTGISMRRATISLSGPSVPRRSVYTDAEGRYAFTGLPAGTYQLNASPGMQRGQYLAAAYGSTAPGPIVRPTPIELAAGQQMTDVNISLPRGSAISGMVTDESGEPLARAQVSAVMIRRGGEPMQTGGAQTDDLGRYRLFGLQPGEYVVTAEGRNFGGGMEVQGDAVGFARAYAPGTPSLAQAQRVRLGRGSEATADIRLGETPLFKISGRVMDSSGQPVRAQSVSVQSTADGARNASGISTTISSNSSPTGPNYEFVVRGLTAGQYEITVTHDPGRSAMTAPGGPPPPPPAPGSGANSRIERATLLLDVSADIEGLMLDVVPLAGHSPNQMGILVDDVFFAADVVLPESVLEKYRIPYLFSLTDHLTALDRCTEVSANHVIPGHGPLLEDITELRNRNLSIVTETMDLVTAYCDVPRTSGDIMTHVLNGREATVSDAPGYYLLQPTINAYLTHLTRSGELVHEIARNRSTWQRT